MRALGRLYYGDYAIPAINGCITVRIDRRVGIDRY